MLTTDTLYAVMLNIIISLVTVLFALIFRGIDERLFSNVYMAIDLLAWTLISPDEAASLHIGERVTLSTKAFAPILSSK